MVDRYWLFVGLTLTSAVDQMLSQWPSRIAKTFSPASSQLNYTIYSNFLLLNGLLVPKAKADVNYFTLRQTFKELGKYAYK